MNNKESDDFSEIIKFFCSRCGSKQVKENDFCSSCSKPIVSSKKPTNSICIEPIDNDARSVESVWEELNRNKAAPEFKNKEWYHTKWVWVWLICFLPVGIYGLRKRKGLSTPKWLFMIFAIYIAVLLFAGSTRNQPFTQISIAPFTKEQVCKGVIASATGQPVNIMGAIVNRQFVQVSYSRPDDNKQWIYRCKLEGNKGIWGMGDGRWRTHSMDSKQTFNVNNGNLYIRTDFSDGSNIQKVFSLNSF